MLDVFICLHVGFVLCSGAAALAGCPLDINERLMHRVHLLGWNSLWRPGRGYI